MEVIIHCGNFNLILLFCYKLMICIFSSCKRVIIWASTRENLSSGICEQHSHRPACAFAQSDQCLCYSRCVKYNVQACLMYKRNFFFLASLCSWAGCFESHFVENPKDRFCHVTAHLWCMRVFISLNACDFACFSLVCNFLIEIILKKNFFLGNQTVLNSKESSESLLFSLISSKRSSSVIKEWDIEWILHCISNFWVVFKSIH